LYFQDDLDSLLLTLINACRGLKNANQLATYLCDLHYGQSTLLAAHGIPLSVDAHDGNMHSSTNNNDSNKNSNSCDGSNGTTSVSPCGKTHLSEGVLERAMLNCSLEHQWGSLESLFEVF